jgi:aspartate-semialdehyde dehydrogenase
MNVGIIGATGAVGREILHVLEKRNFPVDKLFCFASPKSVRSTLVFQGKEIFVRALNETCFEGLNLLFFAAGRKISQHYAPLAVKAGAIVIDSSSFFRTDPKVPLVIPEINAHALSSHQGIVSSPNCTASIMLMALAPLHRRKKIKRIVAASYQAASGAGSLAMKELKEETRAFLEGHPFSRTVMPYPYAFNLFLHNSPVNEDGYSEEEIKVGLETRKILEDEEIKVTATCVRVPVLRAHSIAVNVEFQELFSVQEAQMILKDAPGLAFQQDWKSMRFATPLDASMQDLVLCGRIRKDLSHPHALDLWIVGDQLLKGAALNAVQIAEELIKLGLASKQSGSFVTG